MYQLNIKKLIVAQTLWSFQFHQVVFILFMLSKGFTLEQFFIAEALGSIVSIVAEVPTGSFADRISRKWSLVIATLIHIFITFTMITSDSITIITLAFALGGIARAFRSGADDALLFDSLIALDWKDQYQKINGQMRWYGALALASAGIIGGLLAKVELSYAWWAWFAMAIPLLIVQLSLAEPPFTREGNAKLDSYAIHLGKSFWQSFRGDASYFIWYAAVLSLFFSVGYWFWQPYLQLTGLPIVYFGIFYAVIDLASGFIAKNAYKIEPKIGMRTSLLLIPVVFAIGLVLQSQIIMIGSFLFIFLQDIAGGYMSPILDNYIQLFITLIDEAKNIPGNEGREALLALEKNLNTLIDNFQNGPAKKRRIGFLNYFANTITGRDGLCNALRPEIKIIITRAKKEQETHSLQSTVRNLKDQAELLTTHIRLFVSENGRKIIEKRCTGVDILYGHLQKMSDVCNKWMEWIDHYALETETKTQKTIDSVFRVEKTKSKDAAIKNADQTLMFISANMTLARRIKKTIVIFIQLL